MTMHTLSALFGKIADLDARAIGGRTG